MKCTYCGGTKFYTGPSGGMAQNILCANPDCRHWFNDMGPMGVDDLHKVEPTADEAAAEKAKKQAARDEEFRSNMDEGWKLYESGFGPWKCLINPRLCTHVQWDMLYKLLGYCEAMASDIRKLKSNVS